MNAGGHVDVGVDLDGCLYDFVGAFHDSMTARHGPMPDVSVERWDFYTHYGMTGSEFLEQYEWALVNAQLFARRDPHPIGVQVLRNLDAAGHRLHVVTARGGTENHDLAVAQTENWLAVHRIPYATLNVVPGVKAPTCRRLGVQVAVDDAPHHVDELVEIGVTAVVFDQPWNRHQPGRRIHDWTELCDVVAAVAEQTPPV